MSRNARPHYRRGLGWILGVAFVDTLTRPVRLAQGFTFVRCHGSPRASSPHGLTAPGSGVSRRLACVQLPLARGCYQLAPRRTFTSNPVPMSGTPTASVYGGACLGINWCVEHGHERDDPSASSGLNSRGIDVSLLLARRAASLGFVTSRQTGDPRGQPRHSIDPGRHDVPNARLTRPNPSAESL